MAVSYLVLVYLMAGIICNLILLHFKTVQAATRYNWVATRYFFKSLRLNIVVYFADICAGAACVPVAQAGGVTIALSINVALLIDMLQHRPAPHASALTVLIVNLITGN